MQCSSGHNLVLQYLALPRQPAGLLRRAIGHAGHVSSHVIGPGLRWMFFYSTSAACDNDVFHA